jgi:hypothetical protein
VEHLPGEDWLLEEDQPERKSNHEHVEYYPHYNVFVFSIAYANERSALEGFEMCYDLRPCDLAAHRRPTESDGDLYLACAHWAAARIDPDCEGYRLPTQAEWEYAARAGSTTEYLTGDSPRGMSRYATINQDRPDSNDRVSGWSYSLPICQSCPNEWGIYDMQGGVREWTNDMRGAVSREEYRFEWNPFGQGPLVDPIGLGREFIFDPQSQPFMLETVDPVFEGLGLPVPIIRGANPLEEFEHSRSSRAGRLSPSQLAGFRVVRTAFEEMEQTP